MLAVVVALAGCAAALPVRPRPEARAGGRLLLVSIDSFRPAYLEWYAPPVLSELVANGSRAAGMQVQFPSKTFPNHYSLVTGRHAESHGVVSNSMYDPELDAYFEISDPAATGDGRWWDYAEPVWVTAERSGQRAGCVFWPGSEAEIRGIRPSFWSPYDQNMPYEERVDRILNFVDMGDIDVMTLYFESVDDAGHASGPRSSDVNREVLAVDAALGRLFDGLEALGADDVNIMVVSDHGMVETDPDKVLSLADFIDLDTIEVIDVSPLLLVIPREGVAVEEVYAALKGKSEHLDIYYKDEVPERFHYQNSVRITPIVGVVEQGWTLFQTTGDPLTGTHGYDNSNVEMYGTFIGAGPAFKSGYVADRIINSVDVYSVMCELLGLEPEPNNGTLASMADFLV